MSGEGDVGAVLDSNVSVQSSTQSSKTVQQSTTSSTVVGGSDTSSMDELSLSVSDQPILYGEPHPSGGVSLLIVRRFQGYPLEGNCFGV